MLIWGVNIFLVIDGVEVSIVLVDSMLDINVSWILVGCIVDIVVDFFLIFVFVIYNIYIRKDF